MLIYCIVNHFGRRIYGLYQKTEEKSIGYKLRDAGQINGSLSSEKHHFLLYSRKGPFDLFEPTPIFRTFQTRPPRIPTETIGLLTAATEQQCLRRLRLTDCNQCLSLSPPATLVVQFIFILAVRESFPSCVGYLLLLITVGGFHPCPGPFQCCHCALLKSAKGPEHRARTKS